MGSLDEENPTWDRVRSHPAGGGTPGMALETHLLGVARRARRSTPAGAETTGGKRLAVAAGITALAHDFGKATSGFQAGLGGEPDPDGLGDTHARLGGFAAYYALRKRGFARRTRLAGFIAVARHHGVLPETKELLNQFSADSWWDGRYTATAIDQARDIDEYAGEFATALFDELLAGTDGSWADFRRSLTGDDERMRTWLVEDYYRDGAGMPVNTNFTSAGTYVDTLRLYGTLTFADKTHAAGVDATDDRLTADPIDAERVRTYIDQLGGDDDSDADETGVELASRLDHLRSTIQARLDGTGKTDPVDSFLGSDADVATLTLPTGYGKTLAGLLTAARIREESGGDRIVYALPFTSIIDQTADVLRDVLDDGGGDPARTRSLTVHHHLSEALTLSDDDGDDGATDEAAGEEYLLAESWRAGVTLTTFVQLFESLAGPRNAQSTKLPALYDSVIVVDEPQAIPLQWWPLVRRLVGMLTESFDATVLLMTATQPRIVDDSRTYQLLDDESLRALEREQFERRPARVEYHFDESVFEDDELVTHRTAGSRLAASLAGSSASTLTICNTIDSAEALLQSTLGSLDGDYHDVAGAFADTCLTDGQIGVPPATVDGQASRERAAFVRELLDDAGPDEPLVLFLSTRLRPCDRRFLVAVARDVAREDVPVLVVSTQLVEAGVDVSFDRVYRDFAPLDSIVQAAGRCNRSFERGLGAGDVVVWQLEPPGERTIPPGEAVYARSGAGLDLVSRTRSALADAGVDGGADVDERRVAETAVESYHEWVGQAVGVVAKDNCLYEAFERADGAYLRRASLIDDDLSFELYVCRTAEDRERVDDLREARNEPNFDRVREIRDDLADIRVSVPVYRGDSEAASVLAELRPLVTSSRRDEGVDETERILDVRSDGDYFDVATGVDVPEPSAERRFK